MEQRGGEKSGIWGRVRKGFPEERNIEQNPLEAYVLCIMVPAMSLCGDRKVRHGSRGSRRFVK